MLNHGTISFQNCQRDECQCSTQQERPDGDLVVFSISGWYEGAKNWGSQQRGLEYAGKKMETVDGEPCKKWKNTVFKTLVGKNGDHNQCRNPDDSETGPWCYTGLEPLVRNHCFEFFEAPSPLFAFNALTGQFTVRENKFNFEEQDTYVVIMTASEMNVAVPLTTTKAVQVTVVNVNEAPTVNDQTLFVSENVPLDYPIGAKLGPVQDTGKFIAWSGFGSVLNASDIDNTGTEPQGQKLAWRILAGNDRRVF